MLSLITGAALGLLSAMIAGILGATWGQVLLTYVVAGLVMTVASALVMAYQVGKRDDLDIFMSHGDGLDGHGFDQVTGPDRLN